MGKSGEDGGEGTRTPQRRRDGGLHAVPTESPGQDDGEDASAADARASEAIGRPYAVIFGRVWIAAHSAARGMPRWVEERSDPARGEILGTTRGLFRRTPQRVRIRIFLDDLGLTRVDAAPLEESGAPDRGKAPREIRGFYRQLEALLRAGAGR